MVTSWSPKGSSVAYFGYKHGTSLNCFGSINLGNGELISSFHDKGNTESTIEHFKKVRKKYDKNIPLAFFIDNAPWHKTNKVKEYCKNNNITLLFLPPYSPEFNPIERVWSFLKGKVKQRFFQSAQEFKSFVLDLFENINTTDSDKLANLCCSLI
jgi:transposase